MLREDISIINEAFEAAEITKTDIDVLLANGWRNHGRLFFRYSLAFLEEELRFVIPLRIRLKDFEFSRSLKRTLRKNRNLTTVIQPIEIDQYKEELFERHKQRFKDNIPESIFNFIDPLDPGHIPGDSFEVSVYGEENELLASSFFITGEDSISSIYGMFEPEQSSRSLGIFTMLKEIEYALENGKTYYYQGYAYAGNSFYDYEKRFNALESYDWRGKWSSFSEDAKTKIFI